MKMLRCKKMFVCSIGFTTERCKIEKMEKGGKEVEKIYVIDSGKSYDEGVSFLKQSM